MVIRRDFIKTALAAAAVAGAGSGIEAEGSKSAKG